MANFENEAVQKIKNEQREERDRGMVDGHDANPNLLPEFYFKRYSMLTVYQRAYIFGREVRLMEMEEKKKNS